MNKKYRRFFLGAMIATIIIGATTAVDGSALYTESQERDREECLEMLKGSVKEVHEPEVLFSIMKELAHKMKMVPGFAGEYGRLCSVMQGFFRAMIKHVREGKLSGVLPEGLGGLAGSPGAIANLRDNYLIVQPWSNYAL